MQNEQMIALVQNALEDMKAKDVVVLDVQGKSTVTDYMVIASGTSRRHVAAIVDEVRDQIKQAGQQVMGMEGEDVGDWVLADLGPVVVHVMMPDARSFYDLERLWGFDESAGEAQ